jgi:hypothetical protein
VTARPVRDFDFHPDEDAVRLFTSGPDGVLHLSGDAYASAARNGDIILWHHAFARHPLDPPPATPPGRAPLA